MLLECDLISQPAVFKTDLGFGVQKVWSTHFVLCVVLPPASNFFHGQLEEIRTTEYWEGNIQIAWRKCPTESLQTSLFSLSSDITQNLCTFHLFSKDPNPIPPLPHFPPTRFCCLLSFMVFTWYRLVVCLQAIRINPPWLFFVNLTNCLDASGGWLIWWSFGYTLSSVTSPPLSALSSHHFAMCQKKIYMFGDFFCWSFSGFKIAERCLIDSEWID